MGAGDLKNYKSGNGAMSRSLASLPRRWRSPHGCCGVLLDGAIVFSGVPSSAAAFVHVVLLFTELLSGGATAGAAAVQFRLSEPSVLGLPALQSRLLWDFENVPNAMLFFVRQGPPGLPAVSRFLSNLYQLISLNACHLSATSRCSTVEYSTRRIRRCATRASWSARTSTRASCRSSFSFASHFLQLCRHAGRREGFLGTPPLAPRPAFSLFSLLPPPFFPLLLPSPRAWVWVDVGWEGGREGSSSSSPASLPPHVHSTLA